MPTTSAERMKKWRAENREYYLLRKRARWAERNADPAYRESQNRWRQAYRAANVEAFRIRAQGRRRWEEEGDLTLEEWTEILEEHDHHCYYCGVEGLMEMEHKIPRVRGGRHTKSNVVPACGPCNRKKRTMTADEFMERAG